MVDEIGEVPGCETCGRVVVEWLCHDVFFLVMGVGAHYCSKEYAGGLRLHLVVVLPMLCGWRGRLGVMCCSVLDSMPDVTT